MSLMNWLSKTIWNHGMVTSEGLERSSIPLYPLEAQLFSLSFWHSDCGRFCCIQHLRHSLHQVLGIVCQHFTRLLVSLWVWMKNEEFEGDTEIPNPNSIEEIFARYKFAHFSWSNANMQKCQEVKWTTCIECQIRFASWQCTRGSPMVASYHIASARKCTLSNVSSSGHLQWSIGGVAIGWDPCHKI